MRRLPLCIVALAALMVACNSKQYPECDPRLEVNDWGVTRNTAAFGEFDSLYYLVNPVGNVSDSLYYNGNYTDSYYSSDSTRVMLQFTSSDSIIFCMDRMYAVQTNPMRLIMFVREENDSLHRESVLHLRKDSNSDEIYRTGPDSLFKELLRSEKRLIGRATNGSSASEPEGSQNYEFYLDAEGFGRALAMADSLNRPSYIKKAAEEDSLKKAKEFKLFKDL